MNDNSERTTDGLSREEGMKKGKERMMQEKAKNVVRAARGVVAAVALLAAGGAAEAAPALPDVVVENARMRLVLGGDARAKSLVVKATGEELLDVTEDVPAFAVVQDRPFNNEIKLLFANKRTEFRANRVRRAGDDLFVGFERVSYEAQIRLTERPDYVLFELVDFPLGPQGANHLDMTYPPVDVMRILCLPVKARAHFGDWLNVSWDDASAVSLFAAEPYTWIENARRRGFRLLSAEARRGVRLRGTKAALLAAATPAFLDAMDVAEAELGLPRGVQSRRDPRMSRSIYWTSDLSPENVDAHLALAKRGGFTKMLVYHTAVCDHPRDYGDIADYAPNTRRYPGGYDSIRETLAKVKAAGIMPGLHVLQTFIGLDTHYVAPVADPRLNLKRHFTLAKPLGADEAGDLHVQENPADSPTNAPSRLLVFGGELLSYEGYTTERPYKFTGVARGAKKTRAVAHPRGQIGGVLDVCEFGARSCYIDQASDLQDEIAEKIAKIYDCGFEFMYNDGSEGVNVPQGIHVANAQYRLWARLARKPLYTEGAAKSHFGWHHQGGANAFDVFPPEAFKEMIVRWPLYEAPIMREDFTQVDFGWWNVVPPSGTTVGTQMDMWEFGTSKAAAWDCPATVQSRLAVWAAHPRADDLLAVMRRWEDVRAKRWLTPVQRAALRDPARAFHLFSDAAGAYALCEIEMLPTPPAAKHLRGFLFERSGRRVVAAWHTVGSGALAWALGPATTLAGLRYLETDLPRAAVRAAWAAARLADAEKVPFRD